MFSVLNFRLWSRVGAVVGPSTGTRAVAAPSAVSRAILTASTRRTFLTSSRLSLPAARATATKKPAVKPPKAATAKASPKKKPAAAKPAKKAAPKKKKVVKKAAVKPPKKKVTPAKVPRITKAQGPPSRGGAPYTLFSQEFMAANVGKPFVENARAAGAAWRALSDAEKQPYYTKASAEKEVARKAYDQWMKDVDPELLKRINAQRKERKMPRLVNHMAPKRPLTPYMLFFKEFREGNNLSGNVIEAARAGGAAWKALTDAERDVRLDWLLCVPREIRGSAG
ncbi:hypothetical protein C8R43DRAFT_940815 [Mycena crocata]|nr:hypothetical protein C8R43DRAFT_940815 [Mycena crocata]